MRISYLLIALCMLATAMAQQKKIIIERQNDSTAATPFSEERFELKDSVGIKVMRLHVDGDPTPRTMCFKLELSEGDSLLRWDIQGQAGELRLDSLLHSPLDGLVWEESAKELAPDTNLHWQSKEKRIILADAPPTRLRFSDGKGNEEVIDLKMLQDRATDILQELEWEDATGAKPLAMLLDRRVVTHELRVAPVGPQSTIEVRRQAALQAQRAKAGQVATHVRIESKSPRSPYALSFDILKPQKPLEINLADLNGKVLYHQQSLKKEAQYTADLPISDRTPGTYVLTLKQGHKAQQLEIDLR